MAITEIPLARGFVHLALVLDWFSLRVLSCRLSIKMIGSKGLSRVIVLGPDDEGITALTLFGIDNLTGLVRCTKLPPTCSAATRRDLASVCTGC